MGNRGFYTVHDFDFKLKSYRTIYLLEAQIYRFFVFLSFLISCFQLT